MALVPARAWGAHAVGIAPTDRFQLRRQMAEAAGKKVPTSLSLFLEACMASKWKSSFRLWPRKLGQKEFALVSGEQIKNQHGDSRSLRFRR